MDTLIHADTFFVITSVSVVIITILLIIASVYVLIILSNVKKITHKVRTESDFWVEEAKVLRHNLHKSRFIASPIFSLIRRIISRYSSKY